MCGARGRHAEPDAGEMSKADGNVVLSVVVALVPFCSSMSITLSNRRAVEKTTDLH